MISDFLSGFKYVFKGLAFIAGAPSLWKPIVLPLIINGLVFGCGFGLFLWKLQTIMDRYVGRDGMWSAVLYYLLAFFILVTFVVAAFYVFTFVGSVIASPFNAILSERTEGLLAIPGRTNEDGFLKSAGGTILMEFKKWLLLLVGYLPLLLLSMIPVLGQVIAVPLTIVYSAFAMTIHFLDYTMERHHRGLWERCRLIFSRKALSFGFGSACILFGVIPFINLIVMPVCVTAGTLMYHTALHPGHQPPSQDIP